jgi:hypothetical protein
MDHTGPSWLACLETVVESWLEAGELDGTEQALDRMRVRLDPSPSARLSRATEAILRGRLRLAQGKVEPALTAAEQALEYTSGGAPWWRAKAIRVLEAAGSASPASPRKPHRSRPGSASAEPAARLFRRRADR